MQDKARQGCLRHSSHWTCADVTDLSAYLLACTASTIQAKKQWIDIYSLLTTLISAGGLTYLCRFFATLILEPSLSPSYLYQFSNYT